MNRLKRQTMIKRLVTENEIHTQSELLALLEKENIHTTQATISRDIRAAARCSRTGKIENSDRTPAK